MEKINNTFLRYIGGQNMYSVLHKILPLIESSKTKDNILCEHVGHIATKNKRRGNFKCAVVISGVMLVFVKILDTTVALS